MGGTYDKIMAAKNRAAKNAFYNDAISTGVRNASAVYSDHVKTEEQSRANEAALAALHPELAGQGLGSALARNPDLAGSLLEPSLRSKSQSALLDKEQSGRSALADKEAALRRELQQGGIAADVADDERDAAARAADDQRRFRIESDLGEQDGRRRSQQRMGEMEAEARFRAQAERSGLTPEQFAEFNAAKLTEQQARAKAADAEARAKSADVAPIEGEFYSEKVSPRRVAELRRTGRLTPGGLAEEEKRAIDERRVENESKRVEESERYHREVEDRRRAELSWKRESGAAKAAMDSGKMDRRTLSSFLATPAGTLAYMRDPEFKDRVNKVIGGSVDSILNPQTADEEGFTPGGEGAAPKDQETANTRVQRYTEEFRPKITDKRYRDAFDKQKKNIAEIQAQLERAKQDGLSQEEIAEKRATLERKVESLRELAASGSSGD